MKQPMTFEEWLEQRAGSPLLGLEEECAEAWSAGFAAAMAYAAVKFPEMVRDEFAKALKKKSEAIT